jgi:hypothetical protein
MGCRIRDAAAHVRVLVALVVLGALVLTGCGSTGGTARSDREAARAVALEYMRAAQAADGQRLCAVLSSAAQSEVEIGDTCERALQGGLAGFDGPAEQFVMSTFRLSLNGSTGEASVEFTDSRRRGRRTQFRFPLVRQGGHWYVASALTWR